MTMQTFDPYYHWLGIPPQEQPPNYYRLVGAPLYEPNPAVIAAAADRWLGFLAGMSQTEYAAHANRLYQEIAYAKMYLCHPQQKAAYDAWLQQMAASGSSISRGGSSISAGQVPPVSASASSIARSVGAEGYPAAGYAQPNAGHASSYGSTGYTAIPSLPPTVGASASSIQGAVPHVPQAPVGYGAPVAAAVAPTPATETGPVVNTDPNASVIRPKRGVDPITLAAVGGSLVAVAIIGFTLANQKPAPKVAQNDRPAATTPEKNETVAPATPARTPEASTPAATNTPPAERPVFRPVIAPSSPTSSGTKPPAETPVAPVKPEDPAMEQPAPEDPAMAAPGSNEKPVKPAPPENPGETPAPNDAPNGLGAVSGTPTTEPAPAKPAEEATPEQKAQLERFLKAARVAMSERELEAAGEELAKAKKVAVTDDQKKALARSERMLDNLTQLWDGIKQQMNLLVAGQEFEVKGKIVVVVESSSDLLIIRSSGKQHRWDPKTIPTSVARFLAEQWFKPDAARSVLLGTHYLLDKEGSDPLEARKFWDEAARDPAAKPVVEELRAEL